MRGFDQAQAAYDRAEPDWDEDESPEWDDDDERPGWDDDDFGDDDDPDE